MNTTKTCFDHEKLVAYQRGIQFVLYETVSLLVGLIRSISPERLGEASLPYRTSSEIQEHEQE